jgi:hypothetical protein
VIWRASARDTDVVAAAPAAVVDEDNSSLEVLAFGTCDWNTGTLARAAMSSGPIVQCIDSTARHGRAISLAIISHISFLNLVGKE